MAGSHGTPKQPDGFAPRIAGYFNGIYLPLTSMDVMQTTYGIADTIDLYMPLDTTVDFGQLARDYKGKGRVPLTVNVGSSGKGGSYSTKNFYNIITGYYDETEDTYNEYETNMRGLGLLSELSDERTTQKVYQNVDVGDVIRKLITDRGLQADVKHAGVLVGRVMKDDYAAMARNMRTMEFINFLANGVGWVVRVQGSVIHVGPASNRDEVPVLHKVWNDASRDAGMQLKIKHNSYSAKDTKVKVVSYIPKTKTRTRGYNSQNDPLIKLLLAGNKMDIPIPAKASKAKSAGGGGRQVGFASSPLANTNVEEYIFHEPHMDANTADALAARIQIELAQHEYILDLTFAPTEAEIKLMALHSPNFLIDLTGLKPSANGLYYMKHVKWNWSFTDGLTVNCLCANHELPINTGGE